MSNIFIKTPANAMSDVSNYGLAWLATTIPLLFISVILISSRVAWKDEVLKKTDVGVLIALVSVFGEDTVILYIPLVDTIYTGFRNRSRNCGLCWLVHPLIRGIHTC